MSSWPGGRSNVGGGFRVVDITFDTNVIIRMFQPRNTVREHEKLVEIEKARKLYEKMARGRHLAIIPECVLAEFCAVYSRLTNPSLALRAASKVREITKVIAPCHEPEFFRVVALIDHTFDAIPFSVAHLYGTTFITADEGFYKYILDKGLDKRLNVDVLLLREL